MKKYLEYNFFENFSRLGVAQTPQKSEILSNFGIFGMLTFMYFLIENCDNWCLERCATSYLSKFDTPTCCKCKIVVTFDFYHSVAL